MIISQNICGLYHLENKYSQTITTEFSNILTKSKRKPLKIESGRAAEFYNSIFQNFMKSKSIHHYSRYTDKGPSKAERVIRTICNLLKNPYFLQEKLIGYLNYPLLLNTKIIQSTAQRI